MPKFVRGNRDRSRSVSDSSGPVCLVAKAVAEESKLSSFSKYLADLSIKCSDMITIATRIRTPGHESLQEIVEQACRFLSRAPSLISEPTDPLSTMKKGIVHQLLGNLKLHCELKSWSLSEEERALLKCSHKTEDSTQALCLQVLSALNLSSSPHLKNMGMLLSQAWSQQQKQRLTSTNGSARLQARKERDPSGVPPAVKP